jgi:putative endopeptidase
MRRAALLLTCGLIAATACRRGTDEPDAKEPKIAADIPRPVATEVLANMDRAIDPCTDFYQFACGGWIENTPRPADEPRFGRFKVLDDRNAEALRTILETDAREDKVGKFYAACMDEAAIDARGTAPIASMLEAVDDVEDVPSLMTKAGELHRSGVRVLFDVDVGPDYEDPTLNITHVSQGGLGLPDRDYYLGEDEKAKAVVAAYRDHVATVLGLLGDAEATKRADEIVAFERSLAEAMRPRDEMRDPNKTFNRITAAELGALTPAMPWSAFFATTGHGEVKDANVAPAVYFQKLDGIVANTKPQVLRAYLRWHVAHAFAEHLGAPFVQADFEFFRKKLHGQQKLSPRWKRCVEMTDQAMPEGLGKMYVQQHFAGDSRGVALDMIKQIEAAFAEGLPELAWMDPATRKRAIEKMEAIVNKVGYPDAWRDYGSLELAADHFDNVVAARRFEFDRKAKQVGKAVDKGEWHMSPSAVNAYYNPPNNEMVFPAGILHPPFFDLQFPMAMNFGGIGMVMGHELTHGFDDSGRKFDGSGRLIEWWEAAAVQKFETQAACVEKLYDGYEVQPGVHLNGKLTLGENIADFGGIKQAHRAFMTWSGDHGVDPKEPAIGELTREQLFFVSFGQLWCTISTPEIERVLAVTDPHSHPRYRVNGPLSNLPAFWDAFACTEGEAMHPTNTCEVW